MVICTSRRWLEYILERSLEEDLAHGTEHKPHVLLVNCAGEVRVYLFLREIEGEECVFDVSRRRVVVIATPVVPKATAKIFPLHLLCQYILLIEEEDERRGDKPRAVENFVEKQQALLHSV
eukprot:Mycagemm_TRINITY_DN9104_c0_g2::TRINITY_DN9104_c0_g2_i1::g.2320::m.2320 type:complete len:121 gc:universal TRINITY_DN9104_c0_g2_i1:26-388(+)